MKRLILVLLTLTLMACKEAEKLDGIADTNKPDKPPAPRITIIPLAPWVESDSRLLGYVREYENMATYYGAVTDLRKVAVIFANTAHRGNRVLAYCVWRKNGQNVVVVDPTKWAAANHSRKMLILTHELGHCERGYSHQQEYRLPNLEPKSVMWSFALKDDLFVKDFDYYIDQFFFDKTIPKVDLPNINLPIEGEVACDLEDSHD